VGGRGWAFALSAALAASTPGAGAIAQTLYKWTDKDGKVQYADKPPVNFKGEVTRIETDAVPDPVKPAVKPAARPEADLDEKAGKEKAPSTAARRRADRERLAERLAAARAKVEEARAALAGGEAVLQEEKQIVQQHHPRNARRPEFTPPPRLNCMGEQAADGRAVWNCPTPIPNESYYARQKSLEEALQKAEEELAEAERAYRRGVD
jgi:hypothetical protein